MLNKKIIEAIFADLNESAKKEWRDDRNLGLLDFSEHEDDEVRVVFNMGDDIDNTTYYVSFTPEGYEYHYDGSASNEGDAESVMEILMEQYDSAHYFVLDPCEDGRYKLTDEANGISVKWEVGQFNETQEFDASGFDLQRYGADSARIIATITSRMGDWLAENYPELVFVLNERQQFGAKIARIRKKKIMSIRELAQLADCSPSTIVNIEQGKFSPRVEIIDKILSILGCRLEIVEADIIEDDLDDDIDDIFLN